MRRPRAVARKATKLSLEDEIAHLRDLDLQGLRARWKGVFRSPPPLHLPRHLLFAVLAYRLQADELGDLAPDTVRLLKQIGTSGTTIDAARLTSRVRPPADGTQARHHSDAGVERPAPPSDGGG